MTNDSAKSQISPQSLQCPVPFAYFLVYLTVYFWLLIFHLSFFFFFFFFFISDFIVIYFSGLHVEEAYREIL